MPAAVAEAGIGRFADALPRAESNLATIREHGVALYYEALLLATIARCRLALGDPDKALAAAEESVAITNARGLATCAFSAPITLADVLRATQGADAEERISTVLSRAMNLAREAGAVLFESQIQENAKVQN